MVRIRLTRLGRKHLPFYRVVITPQREKRDSKAIEYVGSYNPITKEINFEKERIDYWLSVGAQPSKTVKNLLVKQGILKADKNTVKYKKTAGKKATERAEKKAAKSEKVEEKSAE